MFNPKKSGKKCPDLHESLPSVPPRCDLRLGQRPMFDEGAPVAAVATLWFGARRACLPPSPPFPMEIEPAIPSRPTSRGDKVGERGRLACPLRRTCGSPRASHGPTLTGPAAWAPEPGASIETIACQALRAPGSRTRGPVVLSGSHERRHGEREGKTAIAPGSGVNQGGHSHL